MDSYSLISEFIVSHFPGSELEIEKIVVPDRRELQTLYKISYSDKVLLTIDNKGVNYLFPNRYRSNWWGWDGIIEGSPEAIAEVVLRDLANSNFATLDSRGRKIIKRPIKLSKTTVCPKCNSLGSIKRYFFGQVGTSTFAKKLAKDRIILGRGRRKNDPEALCTSCDWTGSTEVFRFSGKSI